jgi:imidazolonepropionase-like amidohydrolase
MPDELKLVCDVAHDLGTPVVGHCRGARSVRDAANAGFDFIYHATGMDEDALAAVVERRVPLAPTFTYQANMADYGEAVGADEGLRDFFRNEISDSAEILKRAYDAGVPLLCGSESGFSMGALRPLHYRKWKCSRSTSVSRHCRPCSAPRRRAHSRCAWKAGSACSRRVTSPT